MMREKGGCFTKSVYDIDLVYTLFVKTYVKSILRCGIWVPKENIGVAWCDWGMRLMGGIKNWMKP